MSIESTYRTILTEDYIKDQLSRGVSVLADDVNDAIEALIAESDLSQPQFVAEDHHVTRGTSSSADSFKTTFLNIRQDMRVLYKELIRLSKVNQRAFDRWGLEAESIEKKLIDLEERIENLLILTQDTEGYHSILIDNFTDKSLVDVANTTCDHDLASATLEMASASASQLTRILLNNLNSTTDVTFKVRTTVDQLNRVDAVGSALADIFHQESKTWWTSVNMRAQKPVTCELTVKLGDDPVAISRIFMELHDSAESSPTFITPLYSVDNRNFTQLPTNTFTIEARTTAVFSFMPVQAKYVKFLLTKQGPDPSSGQTFFSYQFGFKTIQFFEQGFDTENPSIFISEPLFVVDTEGVVQEFEKLVLETCERVETDTEIDYYITASNDPDIPLDSDLEPTGGTWVPISPIQRTERLHPVILNVGDILETTIGDTEEDTIDDEIVKISYDGRASDADFVSPAASFTVLSRNPVSGAIVQEARTAGTNVRYSFVNSNERILSHQIKDTDSGLADTAVNIDRQNIILFRNVGKKGFTPGDVSSQVRGIQRGWTFEDPYYSCVIEITNPDGISIDVGDQAIIVDDVTYTNLIDNTILTGRSGIAGDSSRDSGIHSIRVHKNNWREVTPGLDTLAALQAADTLYPYNHKLLIEGYDYGSSYPDTSEQVYTGVDLFAASVMTQVSIFDFVNNIAADRYDVYALDRDAPKAHDAPNADNDPTLVTVVKIDENNPDFQNERFVLRFTLINELRKYLRLRADLSTEDEDISPALHSYKIKLG